MAPDQILQLQPRPWIDTSRELQHSPAHRPSYDRSRSHPNLLDLGSAAITSDVHICPDPQADLACPSRLFRTHSWPPSARALQSPSRPRAFPHGPEREDATLMIGDDTGSSALEHMMTFEAEQHRGVSQYHGSEEQQSRPEDPTNTTFEGLNHSISGGVVDQIKQVDVPPNDVPDRTWERRSTSLQPLSPSSSLTSLDKRKHRWLARVSARWEAVLEKTEKHRERRRQRKEDKAQEQQQLDHKHRESKSRERLEVKDGFKHDQSGKAKLATKSDSKKRKEPVDEPQLSEQDRDRNTASQTDSNTATRPKKVRNSPHELSMTPLEALEYERGRERGQYFSGFSSTGEIIYADQPHTRRRHRTSSGRRSVWREPGTLIRPVAEEDPQSRSSKSREKERRKEQALQDEQQATSPAPIRRNSSRLRKRSSSHSKAHDVAANLDARLRELRVAADKDKFL